MDDDGAMDDNGDCDDDDDPTTLEDCGTPEDDAHEAEVPALPSEVPLRPSEVDPAKLDGTTPPELLEDTAGRVRHRPASQVSLSAHSCGLLQVFTQPPFSSMAPSEQRDWQATPAAPRAKGTPRMTTRT